MGAIFSCLGLLDEERPAGARSGGGDDGGEGGYESIPLRPRGARQDQQMEVDVRKGTMISFIGL